MHASTPHDPWLCTPSSWVCNTCLTRLHARPPLANAALTRKAVLDTRQRGGLSDELYGSIASDHEDGPQLVPLDADSSEGLGGTSDDAFGELVSTSLPMHSATEPAAARMYAAPVATWLSALLQPESSTQGNAAVCS